MPDDKVFLLFANCIPVSGARRSVVCDLQKSQAQPIPNALYAILTTMRGWPLDRIKAHFDPDEGGVIDEYFAFLEQRGLGFWTGEPQSFPPLSLEWKRPEAITNMILDIDETSPHDYGSIAGQLQDAGCLAIQIRFYDVRPLESIDAVLERFEATPLRHIELIAAFHPALTVEALDAFCRRHPAVTSVAIHSSPAHLTHRVAPYATTVSFHRENLTVDRCGHVDPSYFTFAIEHFAEAQSFNTCLNRKLSIAADGSLCNCPALHRSYGDARTTPFAAVMERSEFIQIGGITKDQVEVCRDCEFRYVCTDCRAVLSEPSNPYSKPAHCSYDPYAATWEPSARRERSLC